MKSRDYLRREHVHEVGSAAELRVLRAQLIHDPDVEWISQPWVVNEASVSDLCPACGQVIDLTAKHLQVQNCRCGIRHVTRRCFGVGCLKTTVTPPLGEGCGPIPWDSEAVHDRLFRSGKRKWRPVDDGY